MMAHDENGVRAVPDGSDSDPRPAKGVIAIQPARAEGSTIVVSFSGIDGAGKTTVARGLARGLRGLYRKQVHGHNFEQLSKSLSVPHRPCDYDQEFADAYCTDFLSYAARCRSHSVADRVIIYDRWKTCVRAFAVAFSSDASTIDERLTTVRDADIDFLLDVPVEVALERLRARNRLDVDETKEILSRLRDAYLTLAAADDRIVIVDAAAATVPAVLAHITSLILRSVKGVAKTRSPGATITHRVRQSLV